MPSRSAKKLAKAENNNLHATYSGSRLGKWNRGGKMEKCVGKRRLDAEEKRQHAPVLFSYIFRCLKSFVLRAKWGHA